MTVEKIVLVTQKTFLDELIEKYNSKEQVKFYLEHNGVPYDEYLKQHQTYYRAIKEIKQQLPLNIRYQVIERLFLPTFIFGPNDLVLVVGRDGLVINTAKYLDEQPILGVNPDPERIDGILLRFNVEDVHEVIQSIVEGKQDTGRICLAEAVLNNGQHMIAVNDLFIGHRSHKSARYTIEFNGISENQSSSGIVISTGTGSTGWMSSILANAINITCSDTVGGYGEDRDFSYPWDAPYLMFAVREAWSSGQTQNDLVFGEISNDTELVITSHMTEGGVIFSDGIEEDYFPFLSGMKVRIRLCQRNAYIYKK